MKLIVREIVRRELEETKKDLKNEIKSMIGELVKTEIEEIKKEIEALKETVQRGLGVGVNNAAKNVRNSYAGIVAGKKK